jgi:uncharacterized membrane protein
MTLLQSTPMPIHAARVRRIYEADLRWALSAGWKDFQEKRGDVIFLALIYPVVGLAAAVAVFNDRLLPLFFPLVAGLSIFGPAVAAGFYEIARRRELGLDSTWLHFFDPLRGRGRASLAMMTAGLAILFAGWLLAAWLIYVSTIGATEPAGMADFFRRLFTTPEGWTMIVLGNLVGFAFALVTLVLAVVSFPMVVDKPVDAGTAIATSIRAVMENPAVMASWGLRVAGLLLLGSLPGFVGLAIVLPVLGYATWHLYTCVVER